jgi:hypothetical protein
MDKKEKLILFRDKKIRRIWHNEEWFFSVVDVVEALDASNRSRKYWADLKKKLTEEGFEMSDKIGQLKLEAPDGKRYLTDCANTKSIFRIIQSIPSKKAEPFKRWLAKVGYERMQEIENPELAQDRAKEYYGKKGYPKDWIEKRLRGIAIRQDLTDEWKNRNVKEGKEYAILTNEIAKETFGVSIKEHKEIKSLDPKFENENLRDHMTDLELIFNMLGEKVATEITKKDEAEGFNECLDAGRRGGKVAGDARVNAEKEIGRSVVSKENYGNIKKKKSKKKLVINK